MHEHRAHRTTTRRRVTISAALGVMVALIATGVATLASPVAAAETTSSDVTAVAYGPLPEQLLDVHLPTNRPGPFPVMIYMHSGGWKAGSRAFIPDFILQQVDRAGLAVVSIDYRLVTRAPDGSVVNSFPVPDQDVDRAIRFVKAHAATWDLDPTRVLIAGASAGGHLAALAAAAPGVFVDPTLPRRSRPDLTAGRRRARLRRGQRSRHLRAGRRLGTRPDERIPRLPRSPLRAVRPRQGRGGECGTARARRRSARVPRLRPPRLPGRTRHPGRPARPRLGHCPRRRRPDPDQRRRARTDRLRPQHGSLRPRHDRDGSVDRHRHRESVLDDHPRPGSTRAPGDPRRQCTTGEQTSNPSRLISSRMDPVERQ